MGATVNAWNHPLWSHLKLMEMRRANFINTTPTVFDCQCHTIVAPWKSWRVNRVPILKKTIQTAKETWATSSWMVKSATCTECQTTVQRSHQRMKTTIGAQMPRHWDHRRHLLRTKVATPQERLLVPETVNTIHAYRQHNMFVISTTPALLAIFVAHSFLANNSNINTTGLWHLEVLHKWA